MELLSLYDYLGHPAGKEFGKLVADYAKIRKTESYLRKISNPGYEGYVNCYSREFLDEFFQTYELIRVFNQNEEEKYKRLIEELNTQLEKGEFQFFDNSDKVF